MSISRVSSSSGTINDTNIVPAIQNLSSSTSSSSMLQKTKKSSSSCCSVVIDRVIGDIDLLALILIRLPVKTLLAFKSVSKQWFSIVSDPIFAANHFRRLNPKITGLVLQSGGCVRSEYYVYEFILLDGSIFERGTPPRFGNDPEPGRYGSVREIPTRISQSCNGLLCCIRETTFDGKVCSLDHISTYKAYIYNPTTRQHRCLPPSPFRDNIPRRDDCGILVCSFSLAFDPIKSMNHHYQVVCIWRVRPFYHTFWDKDVLNKYYIEIYSSKTNSWRKLMSPSTNPFHGHEKSFITSGVYWNGCLHWIASGRFVNAETSMYFDLEQELVKPLPALPNGDESQVVYFGECGGHLYLIDRLRSCHTHYDIFKMEKDYSGWKHFHKLDLESLVDMYPANETFDRSKFYFRTILFLEEDETEALLKLVVSINGKEVISYDLKEMCATQIGTYPRFYSFYLKRDVVAWGYIYHYIESLVCV